MSVVVKFDDQARRTRDLFLFGNRFYVEEMNVLAVFVNAKPYAERR